MNTLDAETKQELSDAQAVLLMTETPGWKITKAKLDEKIVELQLIGNVTGETPQDKVTNMEARAMAVDILFNWLKDDIYGYIEQQSTNSKALGDSSEDGYIGIHSA